MSPASPPIVARDIKKSFRRAAGDAVRALDGVSLTAQHGTLTALVGPDGAGKTTLIRLIAGLMAPDAGALEVVGIDVVAEPQTVQDRIGYMPQKFGLYEDLSVQENLDLYADLHGISSAERTQRYPRLMEMTALGPFTARLAGKLSGGMKQKLGLACTLVRSPQLLLLDEPTVGVDPLSRRELWEIILRLVHDEGLTVVVSTSYLDEAERCGHVVVLHSGTVMAQGAPAEVTVLAAGRTFIAAPPAGHTARGLQARLLDDPGVVDAVPEAGRVRFVRTRAHPSHVESLADRPEPGCALDSSSGACSFSANRVHFAGTCASATADQADQPDDGVLADVTVTAAQPRFEDGFMVLLRRTVGHQPIAGIALERPLAAEGDEVVVAVRDLVRQFGAFTAVDHVSFEVRRGEIFGLLGPNGAGKTTTFRMLCGLLPATGGTLRVAGMDLRNAGASARQRIGYVAQKFSLYGQLSVAENLEFFASAYGLRGPRKHGRIDWAMTQFELSALAGLPSGQLPGGYKQRLAMAAALLHEPDILFLDEPTSGADPLARREFWRRITALAEAGVTVIVTTHFMEEAEYCDRVVILDAGKVLAQGTPAEIRARGHAAAGRDPTMEDAFIAIVEEARNGTRTKHLEAVA
jgi:ABC-2 type transport system ATP-binding protein